MRRPAPVGIVLAFALLTLAVAGTTWSQEATQRSSGPFGLHPAPRVGDVFVNLAPGFRRASNWVRLRSYLQGLPALMNGHASVAPLPRALPALDRLHGHGPAATVTWIGHSTLLVRLDGVNFLTDPTWSDRVGPFSGSIGVSRYTPPGIPFDALPRIEFVLISHDHYDHLDEVTVRRLARAFDPRFVVPRGVRAWLARRGIANAVELDWGEATTIRGLEIVCAPAQHGSGRTLTDTGRRLWASWAVIGSKRFYFAGDTGYAGHFALIGDQLGPFDLAALPIGSYTPREIMRPVHVSPEEALQAWQDLRARTFVGIHWGTFRLAREAYDEPPRRVAAEVERLHLDPRSIIVPWPGQTFDW